MTTTLKGRYGDKAKTKPAPKNPIWAGPSGQGSQGGVTSSLLSRYLSCKERFRVLTIEGWKKSETRFQDDVVRMEYGNMWHICEEQFALLPDPMAPWLEGFLDPLHDYAQGLLEQFPMDRSDVELWYQKCAVMFPLYVKHWAEHPDVKNRQPLLQEQTFDVPYKLPSGRVVRLRGKWDSVDLIGGKEIEEGDEYYTAEGELKKASKYYARQMKGVFSGGGIWLQENKTKSSIDQQKIVSQLSFDLQTMLYVIALRSASESELAKKGWTNQSHKFGMHDLNLQGMGIVGVRYNVVRRPLHKSVESMLKKIEDDRKDGRLGEWFARWNVKVSANDIARFKRECLDPVLENLCDDWEWWSDCFTTKRNVYDYIRRSDEYEHTQRHFRMPYFYNPIADGGSGDVDAYLANGSTAGLQRVTDLFRS